MRSIFNHVAGPEKVFPVTAASDVDLTGRLVLQRPTTGFGVYPLMLGTLG